MWKTQPFYLNFTSIRCGADLFTTLWINWLIIRFQKVLNSRYVCREFEQGDAKTATWVALRGLLKFRVQFNIWWIIRRFSEEYYFEIAVIVWQESTKPLIKFNVIALFLLVNLFWALWNLLTVSSSMISNWLIKCFNVVELFNRNPRITSWFKET